MEIKIISTEIIKPSSPTPEHLRTYKPFVSDNAIDSHFPMILFYTAQKGDSNKISSHLKNSLSKTLTYFYPLAGRNKDGISIECNDHGAIFIETQVVAGEMSDLLQKRDAYLVQPLLPLNGNMQEIPNVYDHANLIVQVNYFGCSEIAISICFNHVLVDGSTAAYFVKSWSEVARGADDIKNVVVDCSSIISPYDAIASLKSLLEQNPFIDPTEIVTKAFTFDGRKIAALREKIRNGPYLDRPTAVEAISALLSGTVIKYADRETATQTAVVFSINLRDKVNPPLPPQCIGSLATVTITKLPIGMEINHNYFAAKFRESIRKVVDEYKRNKHGGSVVEGLANSLVFAISDVSKYPYYEADFGWGKPKWATFGKMNQRAVILLPNCDREGFEVWIGLPKKEMAKFEQDPVILAYSNMKEWARL